MRFGMHAKQTRDYNQWRSHTRVFATNGVASEDPPLKQTRDLLALQ